MYENLFGFFGLPENPFGDNPNPRYLVFTQWAQEALAAIHYGIRNRKGLLLLTGEAGTGKTTLIRSILGSLHQQEAPTAFIRNSRLKVSDLLDFILAEFKIPCRSEPKSNALQQIYQWLIDCCRAGKTPVLIVDEAQGLPKSVLEEIRLLLNLETAREKLLQILLAGQPELEQTLKRPELRQLRQRVSFHCKTAPLSLEQTHGYIRERLRIAGTNGGMVFVSEAIDAVHFYSRGIPRVVNLLCEHALINAYADGVRPVPKYVVEEVAKEFQLGRVDPFSPAHIPQGPHSGRPASELPSDLQAPIHSPAGSEVTLEGWYPTASPEASSTAISSLKGPVHEPALIVSREKNGEQASDAIVAARTPSIVSTAEADASPAPITPSVETDSRKPQDLSPVSVRGKVAFSREHAPHPPPAGAGGQSPIRWLKRIPILLVCRSLGRRLLQRRDRRLPFLESKAWRRIAAFILLWLREPIGTVHWHQVKPLVIPKAWARTTLLRWLRQPVHQR